MEVKYINQNLNKFAEYLCKVPNEFYRQEVLLGFSEKRNYYLVAARKAFTGKGIHLSGLEGMGKVPNKLGSAIDLIFVSSQNLHVET